MKKFYICAIIPEQEGNYSVYFPDIPNCFTTGDDLEDALLTAEATVYQYIAAPSLDMVPVRVSVSFPKSTLEAIDQKASAYGFTRSGFLAKAAEQYHA